MLAGIKVVALVLVCALWMKKPTSQPNPIRQVAENPAKLLLSSVGTAQSASLQKPPKPEKSHQKPTKEPFKKLNKSPPKCPPKSPWKAFQRAHKKLPKSLPKASQKLPKSLPKGLPNIPPTSLPTRPIKSQKVSPKARKETGQNNQQTANKTMLPTSHQISLPTFNVDHQYIEEHWKFWSIHAVLINKLLNLMPN
jgi:hypothetical protein